MKFRTKNGGQQLKTRGKVSAGNPRHGEGDYWEKLDENKYKYQFKKIFLVKK